MVVAAIWLAQLLLNIVLIGACIFARGEYRYRTVVEEVPQGDYMIPLSAARVAREGTDITLVGWGQQVTVLERAVNPLPVNKFPICDSTPII